MPRAVGHVEVSAAVRVLRRYPEWATLDARDDFVALGDVASKYRRSTAVQLVAGIVLHGFYHRSAVESMAAALRLPADGRVSGIQWADAAAGGYDAMLKKAGEYHGPQGFPYRWISSGRIIAQSLRPHLRALYDACVLIVACPRPSICAIDRLLPSMFCLPLFWFCSPPLLQYFL